MVNKSSLAKKIASYSALATTMLAINRVADAQIIYTPVTPNFVGSDTSYYLDLNNDGITDFKITQFSFRVNNLYSGVGTGRTSESVNVIAYGSNKVGWYPDMYGAVINSKLSSWLTNPRLARSVRSWSIGCSICQSYYSTNYSGPWLLPGNTYNDYLPLKLQVSGNTYFGWVRLSVYPRQFTVFGYAYDSIPDSSIYAGQECAIQLPTPTIQQNDSTLTTSATSKIQWYLNNTPIAGDTLQSITTTDYGIYSVTEGDTAITCHAASVNFNYINCSTFHPVIATPTPAICGAYSLVTLTLDTIPLYYSVQWFLNDSIVSTDTSNILTTFFPGNYKVVLSEPGGCSDTTQSIFLPLDSNLIKPTITTLGDSLLSSTTYGNKWYYGSNDDSIPGATKQVYMPTESGSYYVVFTDSLGCSNYSNTTFYTKPSGINPAILSPDISITENNDLLTVKFNGLPYIGYTLVLYNSIGQKVYSSNLVSDETIINLGSLAKGLYLAVLGNEDNYTVKKILLQ